LFEEWFLNAPINLKTGTVATWDCVSEYLVRISWVVAVYFPSDKLGREVNTNALVHYSEETIDSIVEELASDAGRMAWMHHGSRDEDPFPDKDNKC
jgi:hypothetical protein